MKFKKLTIENIASIEKAEIDFEKAPIQNNPIFLICGETGSGKSTLLDAICLALYANAPRISSAKNSVVNKDQEGKEIKFKDASQLLRKGADKALAELSFEANNGEEYIVRWKIRTKRGTNRTLEEKRELIQIDSNNSWDKKSEVNKKVEELIGMKYDQFCKTTLLAQGEFTKFLSSDDGEKSEILEKLTGTGIYSQISTAIYERTKALDAQSKAENMLLEKIKTLSEEEKGELIGKKSELNEQLAQNEALKKSVEAKKNWLEEEIAKRKNEELCKSKLEKWNNIIHQESFLRKKECVKKWIETTEVRTQINELKKRRDREESFTQEERRKEEEFKQLTNGLLWIKQEEKRLSVELEMVQKELLAQKGNEEMYNASELIQNELKRYLIAIEEAEKQRRNAEKEREENLPLLHKKRIEIDSFLQKLRDDEKTISTQIDKAEISLKNYNLEQISQQLKLLGEATAQMKELSQERESEQSITKDIQTISAQKVAREDLLPQEKEIYQKLQMSEEEQQAKLERLKMAVSDAVKKIRHSLKAGDECPICGKKIDFIVKDEEFDQAIQPFETKLKETKEEGKKALSRLTESETLLKQYERQIAELNSKREELRKATALHEESLKKHCQELGIEWNEGELALSIEKMRLSLEANQSKANELQKEINTKRKTKDEIIQRIQKGEAADTKNRVDITSCEARIRQFTDSAQNQEGIAKSAKEVVKAKITDANWEENIPAFLQRLGEESQKFNNHKMKMEHLTTSVTNTKNEIEKIQDELNKISKHYPTWSAEGKAQKAEGMVQLASQLSTECTILFTNKSNNDRERKNLEEKINDFILKNDHSKEELEVLRAISKEAHEQMANEIIQAESEKNQAEGAFSNSQTSLKEHLSKKPVGIDENCTIEAFRMELEQADRIGKEIISITSEIDAKLKLDQENHEAGMKIKENILSIEEELSKWNKLNYHFGSSDGKKFRLIAQSYVLRQLLHNANGYLKRLNDRYELSCSNNSLGILVQDQYMGGTLRPCNTLSGGESFIVSLALALGLSSLNGYGLTADIIFIDEGFGTLSAEYLDSVMGMLEKLHNLGGKKVGIISHVDVLKERIPTQIRIKKRGHNGKSEVMICGE